MSSPREESFDYLESLAALNRSVVQFVKESLEENPYCDLSTVGRKYEEHLMALAMASAGGDASKPFTSFSFGDTEDRDKDEQVGGQAQDQGKGNDQDQGKDEDQGNGQDKGKNQDNGNDQDNGHDQDKGQLQDKAQYQDQCNDQDKEKDRDQPPKPVDVQAVYAQRCQVCVMKDLQYVERGVGILHILQTVKDDAKAQLIIRAVDNIDRVLINIIVGQGHSLLYKRLSAQSIMIMDHKVPILLRVDTAAEADELFKKIQKFTN